MTWNPKTLNMSPANNDHLTTLLYFYSTLPQVLGAILALTGTYSIFRLNGLKDDIRSNSQWTIDALRNSGFKFKVLKKYVNIGVGVSLEERIDNLRYSQMSGDFKALVEAADRIGLEIHSSLQSIEGEIQKLELAKSQNNLTQVSEGKLIGLHREDNELSDLLGINNGVIHTFNHIQEFLTKTRSTFIINGIVVALLLSGFFILSRMSISEPSYWVCLIIGISLTVFSLFHILRYIVISMAKGLKGRKYDFYVPPMPAKDSSD